MKKPTATPCGESPRIADLRRWDLVCRVVDNLGDAAVMWRLSRQLAVEHRRHVRLFIDQPEVLRRLVPAARVGAQVDGVAIHALPGDDGTSEQAGVPPCDADVVVAGFHAALPSSYREGMTRHPPVWINLEYLSAEGWIEGFHRLPSPQADGLDEWFFYPGFTATSGGLLRESDLIGRRDAFGRDRVAARFLADLNVRRQSGEALASLLCYPDAPLHSLALRLADSSARLHLLVAQEAVPIAEDESALVAASRGRMRITRIPFLPQYRYDPLLWSCDFNFVRGEDSLVRAIWSGKPFVWQIYPQAEGAHIPKLDAFLRLVPGGLADATRWWNRMPDADDAAMLELIAKPHRAAGGLALLSTLPESTDLAARLLAFVDEVASRQHPDEPTAGKL